MTGRLTKPGSKGQYTIECSEEEHATILAALRLFQRLPSEDSEPENDIATSGGQFAALTIDEIDTLCERINS